jgi:hypothetical protein
MQHLHTHCALALVGARWRNGNLTSWNPLGHSRPVKGLLPLGLSPSQWWFFSSCGIHHFEAHSTNTDKVTYFNAWGWSTRPKHAAYIGETDKIKYNIMVDGSTCVIIGSSWAPLLAKQSYKSIHSVQFHKKLWSNLCHLLLLFFFRAAEFPANLLQCA